MDVLMPQLGETVAEGKITKWFKTAGESIKPGDNLFEIETDKVSMEVPATSGGVLSEIRVQAGAVVPVGAVVAVIAGSGEAVASSPARGNAQPEPTRVAAAAPSAEPGQTPAAAPIKLDPFFEVRTPARNYGPARLPGGTRVSPLARRLAANAGIDLSRVSPSGAHGRITARDVDAAVAQSAKSSATGAQRTAARAGSPDEIKALYRDVPFTEVPLDAMRGIIAARLVEAKQTIPHFYLTADVEIGAMLRLREEVNAGAPKDREGAAALKLSLNDLIIKAWAAALQRVPAANAVWAHDRILRFSQCDIAVAVAIDGGLFTPLIRRAESKTVSAISQEMKELAGRARAKKLAPGEYQGGASSISNLGMYGVREFAAIINPPQSTILAVGAARRQPVETAGGAVAFASVMTVTLSCDHRVVDGALGAELLAAFKQLVEHPVTMLV
ncbi:MAG: dihydrolipoamide acetyltransferase family protein [Xanthobacteraceae bacterium]